MSQADADVLIDQTNKFDSEIRTALRSTSTAVTVALIVLTFGVSLVKDVNRDIGLIVLFPLVGLVTTIHAQAAADVAVMAEVRDRLAVIVNRRARYPLLNVRLISDVRRLSLGTVAINLVLAFGVVVAGIAIIRYAWSRGSVSYLPFGPRSYFAVMLALVVLSCAAVLLAILDEKRGREAILQHLDDVFGCDTRPDHLRDLPHSACQTNGTEKLPECPSY